VIETLKRTIFATMPGGIVHVAADGTILDGNAEALRILGLSFDALTRRYVRDFDPETIHEDGSHCPATEYPVSRAIVTGEAQPPLTLGVRRPDGELVWARFSAAPILDRSGAVDSVIVTFVDVTAYKRAIAEARASDALVRSVLESSPNPIVMTDQEGIVVFASHLPQGRPATDILGKAAWAYLQPDHQSVLRDALSRTITTGEVQTCETRGTSGRVWQSHVGPRREGDAIVGATVVAWDITSLRALEARLAIADRMAAIGTLAAAVAHEVNNPLTYLLVNLEWVAKASSLDPTTREQCLAALEAAQRIRSVVSDVRLFSHVHEGRRVVVDVRDLLDSAVRLARSEIRWRARIVKRYEEVPAVLASEGRLSQVFLNLVVNAAQAIPEGDANAHEIVVSTRICPTSGRVLVEISDTGGGIPASLLPKIFDAFVTTKARGKGTGLGLYVSKEVVESLGGEIHVSSTPGTRTTFRVYLPAAEKGASPSPAPPSSHGVPRALAILVVEDEAPIAELIRTFLGGHEVVLAKDAMHAIELVDARVFDLVLCDVVMPGKTGIDVYEAAGAPGGTPKERFVFMSGGAATERSQAFLEGVPNRIH
jgi:PAS domain S-box-containing protein